MINLFKANLDSQYNIIKEVAKGQFNWRVICQKDPWMQGVDWDIQWTDTAPSIDKFSKIKPYQKINHFPAMFQIARKNYLAKNLKKMQKNFKDDYKFFPKTWLLPQDLSELKQIIAQNSQRSIKQVYIVKPESLSQGKGIFITKRVDQIDPTEHLVVQKYLKYPYLIDGLKFDLRIYVLVTNVQPLRIFIHKEGLARFASEQYQHKSYSNPFIHLTNYAINKDNQNFTSDQNGETGHKRSLKSVYQTLQKDGIDIEKLQDRIDDIIVKTLISIQPDLVHNYRTCQPGDQFNNMCFEILGFDIILNKKGVPQLLEVNHAPSFNDDTNLDRIVKSQLLTDTFRLLNVTLPEKNKVLEQIRLQTEQRIIGSIKITKQQHLSQKIDIYLERLRERDNYEFENLGGYRVIYPAYIKDSNMIDQEKMIKYQQFLDCAKKYTMDIKIAKDEESKVQVKQTLIKTVKPELDSIKKVIPEKLRRNISTQSYKNLADFLNKKSQIQLALTKNYENNTPKRGQILSCQNIDLTSASKIKFQDLSISPSHQDNPQSPEFFQENGSIESSQHQDFMTNFTNPKNVKLNL
ncbi:tubulin-tyrosine ligase family protein [Stylonychia lemnae]|uniref:Tubulin-tyrosine ligase family protein n=1 Tax=Stylonychia lemnae TaxID=5949 RepID=A0A078BA45_STYLE|nr:tubulin-tyrosine ligase family protein [Stylonychia lemnae]|eukprot:CDW90152.1 tubulin-tyrosine ligase family protein [Stylonychia lemnae]